MEISMVVNIISRKLPKGNLKLMTYSKSMTFIVVGLICNPFLNSKYLSIK